MGNKSIPELRFPKFIKSWNERKIGELYNVYSGQTPSRSDPSNFDKPSIAWIKTTDLNNGRINENNEDISVKAAKRLRLLNENTVLIAMYGGFNQIGRTGLLTYPATINQALSALEPIDEINPYFLITELNYRIQEWRKLAASSRKDPNITKNDVEGFILFYPSLQEQIKIGTFFKEIDDLINRNQQKLTTLKQTKQGFLQKMFPKEGETVPEVRFPGFSGEWEQTMLGDIAVITMGQSPRSENYTKDPKDHILVQGNADIKNGWVLPRVWTTQVTKTASIGDIIIGVRAPVGDVGKTNYDVVIGRGVAAVKGNDFLFQLLSKMKIDSYWTSYSTGSTFESINSIDLREAVIKVPCQEEQTQIGYFFKQLDETIALQEKELEALKQTKQAFLQKMFV